MRDFPEGFDPLSQLEVKTLEASARAKRTKKREAFGREAMATLRGIAIAQRFLRRQGLSGLMVFKEKLRDVAVDALPELDPESPVKGVV
ncbi:hypothetical protein Dxin01_00844 [Deinococcus xinjiangensis]|uniref:Uncharacterized protein n=1 Tax=Deinococcus xinjiangensis TaxID=457454 RepID=A0ABP9VCT3_9DEIO